MPARPVRRRAVLLAAGLALAAIAVAIDGAGGVERERVHPVNDAVPVAVDQHHGGEGEGQADGGQPEAVGLLAVGRGRAGYRGDVAEPFRPPDDA